MLVLDKDGNPIGPEHTDFFHFETWLAVLAAPRVLRTLRRVPPRDHLLRMLDAYLPYAGSTRHYVSRGDDFRPDPQRREAAVLHLRDVIERWTSPDIPAEMIEAARAVLREDGVLEPKGGWDEVEDAPGSPPAEECLLWPEGPACAQGELVALETWSDVIARGSLHLRQLHRDADELHQPERVRRLHHAPL